MLLEALTYSCTPCAREYKTIGALKECIAINARYRRQRKAWQPHLDKSKAFTSESIELCKAYRHALVIGAGSLLDVPIEELTKRFEQVTLVDLLFLPSTRFKASMFKNLELVEADVSHAIKTVINEKRLPPPQTHTLPGVQNDTDLIVSANMISQLPLLPGNYATDNNLADKNKVQAWQRELIHSHLDALHKHPAEKCIMADIERRETTDDGETREPCLWGITLPDHERTWEWNIAPKGEIDNRRSLSSTVAAIRLR